MERILVIDDDPSIRALYSVALGDDRWTITTGATKAQARQLFAEGVFDLVVLDRTLPDGDGLDLVPELTSRPETALVPIIVLTGRDSVEDRISGLTAGALDYVSKDATPAEVRARVVAHMERMRVVRRTQSEQAEDYRVTVDAAVALAGATGLTDATRRLAARALVLPDADVVAILDIADPKSACVLLTAGRAAGLGLSTGAFIPSEAAAALLARASEGPAAERQPSQAIQTVLGPNMGGAVAAPLRAGGDARGLILVGHHSPDRDTDRLLVNTAALARVAGPTIVPLLHRGRRAMQDAVALERAIRGEGFRAVFHPVASVSTGAVLGYEGLTRFDDGQSPEPRFRAATAGGRGLELELATLTRQLIAAEALPEGPWVSLNVSAGLLSSDELARALAKVDRQVVLELTEHEPISDYESIIATVAALPGKPTIAIDDAGSGYACLAHVLALNPAYIKLDRIWVTGLEGDPARQALIAGIKHFGDELGATVIAEGVERVEELIMLSSLDIPLVQGHLFGRPDSAESLVDRVRVAA